MARSISGLLVLLICVFLFTGIQAEEKELRIIFTGELGSAYYFFTGKSSEHEKKIENAIKKLHKKDKDTIFIDTGEFSAPAFFNETTYTATPIRMFKEQRYDVVNLGEKEIILGEPIIKKWQEFLGDILVSNLQLKGRGEYLVQPDKILERGGKKIAIICATDKQLKGFLSVALQPPVNVMAELEGKVKKLKEQTKFLILVSDLEESRLLELLNKGFIPLVICKERVQEENRTTRWEKESLLCDRYKKHAIGILNIHYDDETGKIKKYQYQEEEIKITEEDRGIYKPWDAERKGGDKEAERIKPYLPEIGLELDDLGTIRRFLPGSEVKEIIARKISPRQVLKRNKRVFAYNVARNSEVQGRLYLCGYRAGAGGPAFYFLIMFSPEGEVNLFRQTVPANLGTNFLDMDRFYNSLVNKRVEQWQPQIDRGSLAGFYQELFINLIYAVDAVNKYLSHEFPLK